MRRMMKTRGMVLAALVVLSAAGHASAAEYWLRAEAFTKTMPDATAITMWGFALDQDHSFTTTADGAPSVPGPALAVPAGDSTLTVHLYNNNLSEPVSLVINGQSIVPTPVRSADGRVRSFTAETAAGAQTTYTWSNLNPGTYLYQSGTHPAVQVQMGLYGAMTHDFAAGQAYAGTPYAREVVLLYSEIDPALHAAVAGGTYGTAAYPSTITYVPKYFLVNGASFAVSSSFPTFAGQIGETILLRFLNAGLRTHVPSFEGVTLSILAEDGHLYDFPKSGYSVLLPAGKTIDATFVPTASGKIALFDRRVALTNAAAPLGGMLVHLQVGTATAIGVFRNGAWYLDANANGAWHPASDTAIASFGVSTDVPVTGDWNGDGTTDIGVFRNGAWYLDSDGNGSWNAAVDTTVAAFGVATDVPVTGDWDGDGTTEIGVFRNGAWFLDADGSGTWSAASDTFVASFGTAGDIPVTGDWDGSGTTEIGVFRGGQWHLDADGSRTWSAAIDTTFASFGVLTTDKPVTGDWNGDGKSEIGVFRSGRWYLDYDGSGAWNALSDVATGSFGVATDRPVTGSW